MWLCTVLCALWLMWLVSGNSDELKIVCYYRSWATDHIGYAKLEPSEIDPSLCTHLIYAYVNITEDGNVTARNPRIDLPDNRGKAGFEKFNDLRKQNKKLKTLVSTGGPDEDNVIYSKVLADSMLRSKYVQNVVEFVLRYEFDGFDIDWEYPNYNEDTPDDVQNYVLFLKELRACFDRYNLILSITTAGAETEAQLYYDISGISKYVHFILLDVEYHDPSDPFTGHRAPLYSATRETSSVDQSLNTNSSVHFWLAHGAPAEKIILGTRFHGLSYTLKNPAEHLPGSPTVLPHENDPILAYNEICKLTSLGIWTSAWDEEQRVPYIYAGNRWISYDNARSFIEKGKFVRDLGLGGFMVWSIDMDDHQGQCGERYPAMKALNCGLREISCSFIPGLDFGPTIRAIVANPNEDAKRICTRFDIKYVRDPQNCAKFWICRKIDEDEYDAEPFSCGDGLHFDTKKVFCRSIISVDCS